MILKNFRITDCFGFSDSGRIALDPPGGIVFILGRNSSGKTSLLQALRHLELGLTPSEYKNFENFNPLDKPGWLVACFSVEKADLSVDSFLAYIRKKFGPPLPQEIINANAAFQKLLTVIAAHYKQLFDLALSAGEIWVAKAEDGSYMFSLDPGDWSASKARTEAISKEFRGTFPNAKFRHESTEWPVTIDAKIIESELFFIFPSIVFFGESYKLGDDISDRLVQKNVQSPANEVERAFVHFLGEEEISLFLKSNDPDERGEVLAKLRERASFLCSSINKPTPSILQSQGLIEIVLHEKDGLQVVVKADEKKSFYRHLSDNTKILIAYHLHLLSKNIKGGILLFDEPSTGFHSSAQAYLLEFLQSVSRAGSQVVLSTHSEYLIDLDSLPGVRLMSK